MSMASFVQLFEWLSQHPVIAALLVFIVALSESLAFVGLIVPGIFFMVVFGALITTGYLDYGWTLSAAILGAISGDGISYWLGRRYHRQLYNVWPFRNRPRLLERGAEFFHRHGGKSILFGRFVGPMRPIIPAIAGMLSMPRQRFILTNVGSALLWGPIVLLPGMAFGLSLELAAEFAGRLSALLVILLLLLWVTFWVIKQLYFFLVPRTDVLFSYVINWVNRHPVIGRLPAALIDPRHPEMRVLTLLGLMLILAAVAFTALSQFLDQRSLVLGLNDLIYFQLQQLHNPPFDRLMLFFSSLGDDLFLAALVLILFIWTMLYRNWLAGGHLLAAFILPLIVVQTLKFLFNVLPPDLGASYSSLGFPGGHIMLSTAVYGFIAVVLSRDMPQILRSAVYISAALIVLLVGFARLYLGVHWLSDVLGGILLGLIWVGLLGIGYRRHVNLPPLPLKKLSYPVTLILILLVTYPLSQLDRGLPKPVASTQQYRISLNGWKQSGWQVLQQFRTDLQQQEKYPLNLQWVATQEQIETVLAARGWHQSDEGKFENWLRSSAKMQELPIIPHLHEGRYEQLRFIRVNDEQQRILTLRLWRTNVYVQHNTDERPLWIGEVSYLNPVRFGPFRYLKTDVTFDQAAEAFKDNIDPALVTAQRSAGVYQLLLLRSASEANQRPEK